MNHSDAKAAPLDVEYSLAVVDYDEDDDDIDEKLICSNERYTEKSRLHDGGPPQSAPAGPCRTSSAVQNSLLWRRNRWSYSRPAMLPSQHLVKLFYN